MPMQLKAARLLIPLILLGLVAAAGCASGDYPPDPPDGLKAVSGNQSVTLTWDDGQEVDQYTLYFAEKSGVNEDHNKLKKVTSPHRHTPLQNGTTLYYRIQASNANGDSALSAEVSAVPVLTATAPGAPASVTAAAGDGQVTLTWGAVSGAEKYTIYRDTNTGVMPGTGTVLGDVSSPRVDTGVTNGNTYYYVVTAAILGTESLPSAEVYATPKTSGTTVSPPANLTATAGDKQVTLSWPTVSGATGYTLYWSTTKGVQKSSGTAISAATSPHVHSGLTNGSTYYYVVTATSGSLESTESSEAKATPTDSGTTVSPPVYLSAVGGDKQISLTWAAVSGATSYTLYWGSATGVTKGSGTAITSATSPYVHKGLTNGSPYYYVVTATKGATESADSTEATATPKATGNPPSAPINLVAVAGSGKVTLSWQPVSGATGYTLYWSTTKGVTKSSGTAINSAGSPQSHGGLTNGTTYYYVVTAKNGFGESSESLEASAKPQSGVTVPTAPKGLVAVAGDKKVSLSWPAVSGATSYTLYWSLSSSVSKSTGTGVSKVTSPYVHSPLTNGTTYHYVVTAKNSAGESGDSNKTQATPKSAGGGTIVSTLSGGAYAVVWLENTQAGQGVIQFHAYTSSTKTVGIQYLTVVAGGAAKGTLPAAPSAGVGVYQGTTSSKLTPGTYTFTVGGTVSGAVSATINTFPTCSITSPAANSSHSINSNINLTWKSTNSQLALISIIHYSGKDGWVWKVEPDSGGAYVPAGKLTFTGISNLIISGTTRIKATAGNAELLAMGDDAMQLILK